MTIEEKAKRYDEALTKARNIVNSINVGLIGKDSFEAVFPELKESEDERIKKEIISAVNIYCSEYCRGTKVREDMLTWLEKQGKQKLADNVEPKWKPSDEEMGVIEAVINNMSFQRRHLDSLYEQLKKLKS